jgi:hypothetical protein
VLGEAAKYYCHRSSHHLELMLVLNSVQSCVPNHCQQKKDRKLANHYVSHILKKLVNQ